MTQWQADFLPAYLSNGVVGMRIGPIPMVNGTMIVSGFEGEDPELGVHGFAPAPFVLHGDVRIGSVSLGAATDCAELQSQRYDFACGELVTRFRFHTGEAVADVQVLTFCSRTHPGVVAQEVTVTVDRACDLTIRAGIDHTRIAGELLTRRVRGQDASVSTIDGALRWRSFGGISSCGAAYASELAGDARAEQQFDHSRTAPLGTGYALRARPGRRYRLRQLSAVVCDLSHSTPDLHAVRLLVHARLLGFDALLRANRAEWQRRWQSRVVLEGAPTRWQAMADAAFFYLHTSVHQSSVASTSLFGLAYWPTYHYYRGHVMWDIETFAVPPLLLTDPGAAAAMLRYRFDRRHAARLNAQTFGYEGLQYPWESSMVHGYESAPTTGLAPGVEHHVSPDIAVAMARFVHATDDMAWARNIAWPVLSGVADWIVSRADRTRRGYEIKRVNGVAEIPKAVDNNAFVNMMAVRALEEAAALADRLQLPAPLMWTEVARRLVVPRMGRDGILANHDDYDPREEKGATPEALAGLFPGDFGVDEHTERRSLEYYLDRIADYVGSPMLSSVLGVYAARLGDRRRALDLFESGYAAFVRDPYTATLEYSPTVFPEQPQASPFTANLGGFLCACMYGLTGVRLGADDPSAWPRRPITLPRGWDAIRIERLTIHGRPASLLAEHGAQRATISWL